MQKIKQESKTVSYNGLLSLHQSGDASDVLYLSSVSEPLAYKLSWISNKNITVRYWITDIQVTQEQAETAFLQTCMGMAEVKFKSHYSEMTGYLFTDEDLIVGGHDLMAELKSYVGKWLILEIKS